MYLIFKLVHIVAVILFLGNIITGLFWKHQADRTNDPRIIANTLSGLIRSDRWFTIPGTVVIVAAGLGTAIVGQIPLLRTGWIFWSIVLFTISGLAFSFRVAPLQVKLAELAQAGVESGQFDQARYQVWSRQWEFWGLVALLTPAIAVGLMVLKPVLPTLW